MHNQMPPQQDFFIYVPSAQEQETHASTDVEQIFRELRQPTIDNEWVKISLAGQVTIYARVLEDIKEVA